MVRAEAQDKLSREAVQVHKCSRCGNLESRETVLDVETDCNQLIYSCEGVTEQNDFPQVKL